MIIEKSCTHKDGFEINVNRYTEFNLTDIHKSLTKDGYSAPFAIRDTVEITGNPEVIEVSSFIRKKSDKGGGNEILSSFCKMYGDEKIILLLASPLVGAMEEHSEAYNEGTRKELLLAIGKLTRYYESVGFKNVNDIMDCEYGNAMIFMNSAGKRYF
ncbi:MAG: hypothetical protein K9L62_16900 [Vallitaleaceae bacterium]|nr:hypothetical protein [Vallitaleaceae bacterium]